MGGLSVTHILYPVNMFATQIFICIAIIYGHIWCCSVSGFSHASLAQSTLSVNTYMYIQHVDENRRIERFIPYSGGHKHAHIDVEGRK